VTCGLEVFQKYPVSCIKNLSFAAEDRILQKGRILDQLRLNGRNYDQDSSILQIAAIFNSLKMDLVGAHLPSTIFQLGE